MKIPKKNNFTEKRSHLRSLFCLIYTNSECKKVNGFEMI